MHRKLKANSTIKIQKTNVQPLANSDTALMRTEEDEAMKHKLAGHADSEEEKQVPLVILANKLG